MRIILTGATGQIGSEVLVQCIKSPYIHHVYCLVRKPLLRDHEAHPKVTQLFHEDFEKWPADLLEELQGVSGCIWTVGGAANNFANLDEARKANVGAPLSAAEAFCASLIPHIPSPQASAAGKRKSTAPSTVPPPPFRFIYLSCWGAEPDQNRSLWSQAATRKMKGACENGLFELADSEAYNGRFEPFALRLGKVQPGGQSVGNMLQQAVSSSVSVERVARCCLRLVLDGWPEERGKRVLENAEVLGEDWAEINVVS